jgi:hypothetical protein
MESKAFYKDKNLDFSDSDVNSFLFKERFDIMDIPFAEMEDACRKGCRGIGLLENL